MKLTKFARSFGGKNVTYFVMARNQELFYHNLSTMLDAGLPILRALKISMQGSGYKMRETIAQIDKEVSEGSTLSGSLRKFATVFPRLDVLAIEAAENSGSLPDVLQMLSQWHHLKKTVKGKMVSGLAFPAVILVFASLVIPLPGLFLGFSTFSQAVGESVFIMSIFFVPAAIIYLIIVLTPKTGSLRYLLDTILLMIPILRKALKHLALSRYCYSFYILIKAGVPITECTRIATQTTTNLVIAGRLRGAEESVQNGRAASEGFKEPLPDGFIDIWKTAEESGQFDVSIKKLADMHAETALFKFQQFSYWLPRFIYFLVCLVMIYYIFRNVGMVYSGVSL